MEALILVACLKGFEPPANGLEVRCSIQLSYRHIFSLWSKRLCRALPAKFRFRHVRRLISSAATFTLMERVMGIGPTQSAWKADVLPLNYTRTGIVITDLHIIQSVCPFVNAVKPYFKSFIRAGKSALAGQNFFRRDSVYNLRSLPLVQLHLYFGCQIIDPELLHIAYEFRYFTGVLELSA